jgi:hypothetical protein
MQKLALHVAWSNFPNFSKVSGLADVLIVPSTDWFTSMVDIADGVSLVSWLDLMEEHPELLSYKSERLDQTLLMSACLHVSSCCSPCACAHTIGFTLHTLPGLWQRRHCNVGLLLDPAAFPA